MRLRAVARISAFRDFLSLLYNGAGFDINTAFLQVSDKGKLVRCVLDDDVISTYVMGITIGVAFFIYDAVGASVFDMNDRAVRGGKDIQPIAEIIFRIFQLSAICLRFLVDHDKIVRKALGQHIP